MLIVVITLGFKIFFIQLFQMLKKKNHNRKKSKIKKMITKIFFFNIIMSKIEEKKITIDDHIEP